MLHQIRSFDYLITILPCLEDVSVDNIFVTDFVNSFIISSLNSK